MAYVENSAETFVSLAAFRLLAAFDWSLAVEYVTCVSSVRYLSIRLYFSMGNLLFCHFFVEGSRLMSRFDWSLSIGYIPLNGGSLTRWSVISTRRIHVSTMSLRKPPRQKQKKAVPLTVRARAVVVSGGAINTPAILLRSGLKHPMIGRHLCLHPVLVVGGVFPEDYNDEGDYGGRRRQGTNADESKCAPAGSMAPAPAGQQVGRVDCSALFLFYCCTHAGTAPFCIIVL